MSDRSLIGNRIDSYTELPNEYVVFDIETTGLLADSEIIQLSAIRIVNEQITDDFNTFVHSTEHIPSRVVKLTGITDAMISEAPSPAEALGAFLDFVGDACVVAHNGTTFDIIKVYDACEKYLDKAFSNDFFDTLYFARCVMKLENYKLSTLCEALNVDAGQAHRADSDCVALYRCLIELIKRAELLPVERIRDQIRETTPKQSQFSSYTKAIDERELCQKYCDDLYEFITEYHDEDSVKLAEWVSGWLENTKLLTKHNKYNEFYEAIEYFVNDGSLNFEEREEILLIIENLHMPDDEIYNCRLDDICGMYQKNICATGEFENRTREQIEAMVIKAGGKFRKTVTSNTDYLIVGSLGSPYWSCGNYGTKIIKATEINENGGHVKILKECDFVDYVERGDFPDFPADGNNINDYIITKDYLQQQFAFLFAADGCSEMNDSDFFEIKPINEGNAISVNLFKMLACHLTIAKKLNGWLTIPEQLIPHIASVVEEVGAEIEVVALKSSYRIKPLNEKSAERILKELYCYCRDHHPFDFDCCSRYMECSDNKKCVHPDIKRAIFCSYRKKLNKGIIYYGKNKTIE